MHLKHSLSKEFASVHFFSSLDALLLRRVADWPALADLWPLVQQRQLHHRSVGQLHQQFSVLEWGVLQQLHPRQVAGHWRDDRSQLEAGRRTGRLLAHRRPRPHQGHSVFWKGKHLINKLTAFCLLKSPPGLHRSSTSRPPFPTSSWRYSSPAASPWTAPPTASGTSSRPTGLASRTSRCGGTPPSRSSTALASVAVAWSPMQGTNFCTNFFNNFSKISKNYPLATTPTETP